jgi:hypothetical protein
MTDKRYFRDIEVEESDDRFETVEAVRDDRDNRTDHTRVSKKLAEDGSIAAIAIQPFKSGGYPHPKFGVQLEPDKEKLDRLINGLEMIRMEMG